MANRTFGWIQNPSSTETLRDILSLFVPGSPFHKFMQEKRLPFLASANLFQDPGMFLEFQKLLRRKGPIKFEKLKGQGNKGKSRTLAKCSGLAQAAVTGQKNMTYIVDGEKISTKKPYTDDWTADGFLRWAISLGFLDYNYSDDSCDITTLGKSFVGALTEEEKNKILGEAYLSYPPVCRILGLLLEYGHLTKFELGAKLGFTDEKGFTSFPQNIWVQAYEESVDPVEKRSLLSNSEGSSDKYARMICGWLEHIGWVRKVPKSVTEKIGGKIYNCVINFAYEITEIGKNNYLGLTHDSQGFKTPKIVYREMLASKAPNAQYLRNRRSLILNFLQDHQPKSIKEIIKYLETQDSSEEEIVIEEDLKGLINIGLNIEKNNQGYKLNDEILKLILYSKKIKKASSKITEIKDRVRTKLTDIDHKFLTLIDYAYSGKKHCREFEIYTIDLFINELNFNGSLLGGVSKPDSIIYHDNKGAIIDNKAYSKGFTITRTMADEMIRYLLENKNRNPEQNPLQWWLNFDASVTDFYFVFISSLFKGEVTKKLNNIMISTGVNGCAIDIENLLYFANAIKNGTLSLSSFMSSLGLNKELFYSTENSQINE